MRRGFVHKWWPTVVTLAAVLWLTLAPDPMPDTGIPLFPGADKVVHALMMGGLTSVILFDLKRLRRHERLSGRNVVWTAVAMVAFSALDEWAQGAMAMGRSADILDLAADCTGILLASLAVPPLLERVVRPKKSSREK